jgi:hypothetical protein
MRALIISAFTVLFAAFGLLCILIAAASFTP